MTVHKFPPSKILIPTDFGPASAVALAYARLIYEEYRAALSVIHAHHFELPPYFSSGQVDSLTRELKKARKTATEYLHRQCRSSLGGEVEVALVEKPPVDAIIEASADPSIDLIIMGTHGHRGAERLWLGSVAEGVLKLSKKPVMAVHRTSVPESFKEILCPVNDTPTGQRALEYAGLIASAAHANLTVLNASETGDGAAGCGAAGDEVKRHCEVMEISVHGNAAQAILNSAHEKKPSLIVMGAEWKSSAFGELFSSTTERVMQHLEVPLLVVPKV
jgi:nucleotide-binding universal stress UspA family protein